MRQDYKPSYNIELSDLVKDKSAKTVDIKPGEYNILVAVTDKKGQGYFFELGKDGNIRNAYTNMKEKQQMPDFKKIFDIYDIGQKVDIQNDYQFRDAA